MKTIFLNKIAPYPRWNDRSASGYHHLDSASKGTCDLVLEDHLHGPHLHSAPFEVVERGGRGENLRRLAKGKQKFRNSNF